jgi:hypothetical protein
VTGLLIVVATGDALEEDEPVLPPPAHAVTVSMVATAQAAPAAQV